MSKSAAALIMLTLAAAAPAAAQSGPRTIEVTMATLSPTSFAFQPSQIAGHPGDTLRFVQSGPMPHNVQFLRVPAGASLGAAMMGTFLTVPGQVYTLVLDERFVAGSYDFTCTPHQAMGMNGTLTVAPRGSPASSARR